MDAKCFNCGKKVGEFDNLQSSIAQLNKALTKITAPADFYLFCDPCGTLITQALDLLKKEPQHFWGKSPVALAPDPNSILDEILRRTKTHNLDRNKKAPQKEVINTQKEEPVNIAFEQLMKESGMM